MKFIQLTQNVYYFHSAVNIGYITKDGKGLLIDTGIDSSAIKKVIKQLSEQNLPLDFALITHAHADHMGGAKFLKQLRDVELYAPDFERAIMENTLLEPIYLWNGAEPLEELKNKFLLAPSVRLDASIPVEDFVNIGPFTLKTHFLPGHSYGQVGISYENILFAADAFFGQDVLHKHKIPFIVSVKNTMNSLHKLMKTNFDGAVPGHGLFEENYIETVSKNLALHESILTEISEHIQEKQGVSFQALQQYILSKKKIEVPHLTSWLLFRTSVTAYVTHLVDKGRFQLTIQQNELMVYCLDS
ncbi:MBL fold metallo-hydrolase [Bacillus sp. 2205SS5-2]|uniref:MBL fold metallo-hydrolase n=1 Tax=Bacillus sp. 2205SS5-2 TaxID=3109031 RepID=UPI003006240F